MLKREPHLPAAGTDTAQWCTVSYIDGALTRREILRASGASDTYLDWQTRFSKDNGRTWSPPSPLANVVDQQPGGGVVTFSGGAYYEPRLGILYEPLMRRLWAGLPAFTFDWQNGRHPFTDHSFVNENGQERLLRYERGPDYDPENPFASAFAGANRAYFGVGMAFAEDGTAWYPLVCRPGNRGHAEGGVVLMRRDASTGEWAASNPVFLAPERSSRGLLEPDVALLRDGRLLVVMRGSSTAIVSGHKWFTVSTDGGRTLSPVEMLCYEDGTAFYSPSSIHSFIRSTRNGRLYWLANIVPTLENSRGNGQRYPLFIAEIDEDELAVRRESLVLVDTRREGDSEGLQLSNFSVIENRESLDIEIYLTCIGANRDHYWQAGVDKYIFAPPGA